MVWLLNIIFSFVASCFFAVVFDSPKRLLLPSGAAGCAAWMTGKLLTDIFDIHQIYSYFFSSLILGIVCRLLSNFYKEPPSLFMIPGIIPLVPGGLAYDATMKLMLHKVEEPISIIIDITLLAGGIAAGLLCADYVVKIRLSAIWNKRNERRVE